MSVESIAALLLRLLFSSSHSYSVLTSFNFLGVQEYENEMTRMRKDFEEMKMTKEKLEEEMSHLQEHYQQEIADVEAHISSPGQRPVAPPAPQIQTGRSLTHVQCPPKCLHCSSVEPEWKLFQQCAVCSLLSPLNQGCQADILGTQMQILLGGCFPSQAGLHSRKPPKPPLLWSKGLQLFP